jgi:hypothetical protein
MYNFTFTNFTTNFTNYYADVQFCVLHTYEYYMHRHLAPLFSPVYTRTIFCSATFWPCDQTIEIAYICSKACSSGRTNKMFLYVQQNIFLVHRFTIVHPLQLVVKYAFLFTIKSITIAFFSESTNSIENKKMGKQ